MTNEKKFGRPDISGIISVTWNVWKAAIYSSPRPCLGLSPEPTSHLFHNEERNFGIDFVGYGFQIKIQLRNMLLSSRE